MKKHTLKSMTDFVLEVDKEPFLNSAKYQCILSFTKFLKQTLKLGMFIPCDENDNPLEEPKNYELWGKYGDFTQYGNTLSNTCRPYQQAKERVLFDGFDTKGGVAVAKAILATYNSIEDLTVKKIPLVDLELTESAVKQIEL